LNTRAAAADILVEVVREGRSLTSALEQAFTNEFSAKDRTFIQAVCYGVLRWYWRLNPLLGLLTRKPIKDDRIRMIALIGFYQIGHMRVAPHAAVSETVEAVQYDAWAKPLINAILRNYQRNREELESQLDASPSSALAHPQWLYDKIRRDWPDQVETILKANNEHPPLTLRANLSKGSREQLQVKLSEAGMASLSLEQVPTAIVLAEATSTELIPGFKCGELSVQDAAAQIAATLLDLAPGQRVLDLCAAPGGKTCHILEACPELSELVALDVDAARLERVKSNLTRGGLTAHLITGDATQPSSWWDGRPFDRILVDAPCSATGVIRRHPDIKVLRKPQDIARLAETQRTILEAAWTMLAPGGTLVYATCSVLRQENSDVISAFLGEHPEAKESLLPEMFGQAQPHGRQILPGTDGMDGFFYARLEKHPA
jgi:16S rRNA (cytosine967-C5)-methyltransferase